MRAAGRREIHPRSYTDQERKGVFALCSRCARFLSPFEQGKNTETSLSSAQSSGCGRMAEAAETVAAGVSFSQFSASFPLCSGLRLSVCEFVGASPIQTGPEEGKLAPLFRIGRRRRVRIEPDARDEVSCRDLSVRIKRVLPARSSIRVTFLVL